MPATVLARHAILVVKRRWSHAFDEIALAVGSVSPDLTYAFQPWLLFPSHEAAALH